MMQIAQFVKKLQSGKINQTSLNLFPGYDTLPNYIVSRGVLTPLFYEPFLYYLPSLFQILSNLPLPSLLLPTFTLTALSVVLFFLAEWVIATHLMCYFT